MQLTPDIKILRIFPLGFIMFLMLYEFCSIEINASDINEILERDSDELLMERGRRYLQDNHTDSALMVFSYIEDIYSHSNDNPRKRLSLLAKNNIGVIYSFKFFDFARGYNTLLDAFDLAESAGFEDAQVIICHNIVELLQLYKLLLPTENVSDLIDYYTNIGIEKAVRCEAYRPLSSMVINRLHNDPSSLSASMKKIYSEEIPDSIEGVAYARRLIRAAELLGNGDCKGARREMEDSYGLLPEYGLNLQPIEGYKRFIAHTYAHEKNWEMAEKIGLEGLAIADSMQFLDSKVWILTFLSNLPVAKKDEYMHRLLLNKDSIMNEGRLQMITEIDFRRSLDREREANKRLMEQHTRLYYGLGIGISLLLLFIVLLTKLFRYSHKLRERNAYLYSKIQQQLDSGPLQTAKSVKSNNVEPSSDEPDTARASGETAKYLRSSLTQEKMDELRDKLLGLLADEEWVCNPDVSLARAASELNANTAYLSRTVNEQFGVSFSTLLLEYRIRIATRRMSKGSPYVKQTIEAIANSVGYSSRSSFITAFKKINGMTPSEYIKISNSSTEV